MIIPRQQRGGQQQSRQGATVGGVWVFSCKRHCVYSRSSSDRFRIPVFNWNSIHGPLARSICRADDGLDTHLGLRKGPGIYGRVEGSFGPTNERAGAAMPLEVHMHPQSSLGWVDGGHAHPKLRAGSMDTDRSILDSRVLPAITEWTVV